MKAKKFKPQPLTNSLLSALPKSWSNSKLTKQLVKLWQKPAYRIMAMIVFFVGLWLACSYVFYLRFPNNYRQPNFFAEEGAVFGKNIIEHGFLGALGTTFNGYYIWGIYILEKLGFMVNAVFYNGEFVNLPRSFALVSYGFFGLIAALPAILFRNYLKPFALVLITLFILFVPLGGWDYGILGTLGNTKFSVVFIAFMLLAYRNMMPAKSRLVYLVDLGLLVCAYTNVTIYAMMPFALVRYWPKLYSKQWLGNIKTLLNKDRGAQSLVILGLALLPQLYIVKRYGVPALPGYLDTPFDFGSTIEIFIARSYLFSIVFMVYKYLTDLIVVGLFIAILALMWKFSRRYFSVVSLGLFTIFVATFLFAIKRTGLSVFFTGYQDPGPSQFFFAQNWVFGFIFSILLVEMINRLSSKNVRVGFYTGLLAIFAFVLIPRAGTYGQNNFMEKSVGNIYAVAQEECKQTELQEFDVENYPSVNQQYPDVSREQLCTPSAINYRPSEVTFKLLPEGNNYIDKLGQETSFTQSFISPYDNLDGISVYFSTFLKTPNTDYELKLFGQDCQTLVLTTNIKSDKIKDNSFYTIKFSPVEGSANQSYCFSISATETPADPLAVQLSADNLYTEGGTTINNQPSTKDIVFGLHYK